MVRRALPAAGFLLAVFHAWLFFGQVSDGRLADPALLLRWVVAAGIVWFLAYLRARGVSPFWGRKAVAVWLLAGLLHGPQITRRLDTPTGPMLPDFAGILTQTMLGAAAATGLLLLFGLRSPRRVRHRPVVFHVASVRAVFGALSSEAFFRFVPRPPPAA
jgi:hypothetical protein